MNRTILSMFLSLVVLFGLLILLANSDSSPVVHQETGESPQSSIMLYCAASNRVVVEAIRDMYQSEFGHKVEIQYGASQTLLSAIEVSQTGDLYLPADDSYLKMAAEKELIKTEYPLARMKLVIAVEKGNPKNINSLQSLLSDDIIFVQANPDAAAVGMLTKEILEPTGFWRKLEQATAGYRTTVTDVANDVTVGAADAAIIYDAVLSAYPNLDGVEVPEFETRHAEIVVGVLSQAENPIAASHFARYLSAEDRGQELYRKFGFQPAGGEQWSDYHQADYD